MHDKNNASGQEFRATTLYGKSRKQTKKIALSFPGSQFNLAETFVA